MAKNMNKIIVPVVAAVIIGVLASTLVIVYLPSGPTVVNFTAEANVGLLATDAGWEVVNGPAVPRYVHDSDGNVALKYSASSGDMQLRARMDQVAGTGRYSKVRLEFEWKVSSSVFEGTFWMRVKNTYEVGMKIQHQHLYGYLAAGVRNGAPTNAWDNYVTFEQVSTEYQKIVIEANNDTATMMVQFYNTTGDLSSEEYYPIEGYNYLEFIEIGSLLNMNADLFIKSIRVTLVEEWVA